MLNKIKPWHITDKEITDSITADSLYNIPEECIHSVTILTPENKKVTINRKEYQNIKNNPNITVCYYSLNLNPLLIKINNKLDKIFDKYYE